MAHADNTAEIIYPIPRRSGRAPEIVYALMCLCICLRVCIPYIYFVGRPIGGRIGVRCTGCRHVAQAGVGGWVAEKVGFSGSARRFAMPLSMKPKPKGFVSAYTARRLEARRLPLPGQASPLKPLEPEDEVLLKVIGKLNSFKTRLIDLFRGIDDSGDGAVSPKELREGLSRLGLELTENEALTLLVRADKDGSGDLDARELDRALKAVEKQARNEGLDHIIDTWARRSKAQAERWLAGSHCGLSVADTRGGSFWEQRSVRMDEFASQLGGLKMSGPAVAAVNTQLSLTQRSAAAAAWRTSSKGPAGAAHAASMGGGSVLDGSVNRQRLIDTYASPRAMPPSLKTHDVPLHNTVFRQPMVDVRFGKEPVQAPHESLVATKHFCATARRDYEAPQGDFGVKKFFDSPMMQSSVDQVVFQRDMDMSGDTKFDHDFIKVFDGRAGMPSWRWGY